MEALARAGQGLQAPPLRAFPRTGPLPLSFAQQRLWFLDQLEPDSPLYNMPSALRLEGALVLSALEQSFAELLRRHESLRTTFQSEAGQPVQVISPARALPMEVVDLSRLPEVVREAEARRLAGAEAQRPFNLATGPLVRITLLRLSEQEHVLLLTMHHIVSDGWSTGVLVRELAALYDAFARASRRRWRSCRSSTRTTRAWQRGWLQGEVLEAQLSYWRQQLEGAPRGAGAAHGPSAPGGADVPGRDARLPVAQELCGGAQGAEPAGAAPRTSWCCWPPSRRCCTATPGRMTSASGLPSRAATTGSWSRSSASSSTRLVLRTRLSRELELPGAAGPGAGDGAGGVRPPGRAVREAGGGAATQAGSEPAAAVSGAAGPPERAASRT